MITTIDEILVGLGTTLEGNEDTAIQRKGANLVDAFFMTFNESDIDMPTTADVLHYLTDIQVRDYALGIIDKYNVTRTKEALLYLVDKAPTDSAYINAPATLLAQLYYEEGNKADAFLMLINAQKNYSLALLLDRVFRANWNPEAFKRMRTELHPKVVAGIYGEDN